MAFTNSGLVLLAHGNDKKLFYYDGAASSDSLATIQTAGYFNNSDDDIRMAAKDLILVNGSSGFATLEVTAVSSGSVTTQPLGVGGFDGAPSTAVNLANAGTSDFPDTAAKTYILDAPEAGAVKMAIKSGSSTAIVTLNSGSTSVTFDGSNQNLTFDGAGEAVVLVGQSATRWLIISNQGTVGAS